MRVKLCRGWEWNAGAVIDLQHLAPAGLNYIRRSLRERAAEVQAGKMQMHHQRSLSQAEAVVEGYLRPMRVHHDPC